MMPDLRLIEAVPVAAYTLRLESDEFVLQGVNAAALKRNSEILLLRGKPLASLYRDHPEVIEDARRCIREQTVVERDHQVRRYDRTEATQHLRLTFVPAGAEYMVLFLQDVADPDMMQTALRESDARYRTLMASLPDAVLLLGADGRVLYCNEHAVALFGATSTGSLVGESAVLPPGMQLQAESGAAIACDELPCWHVLATGQPEIGGVFAFKGESGVRWARIAAQPILGARGEVKGSISILTDLTERMNAQAALSESAARLDLTLAEARMGVWEFEVGKEVGWWSPTLTEVFKVVSDNSSLEKLLEQVHPDDRESVLALFQTLAERKHGDEFLHECRIVGADNVTRHARIRGRIPCDASGRKLLRGTVTDITEQRTLEEELRRANRLESIGRLAGGVAHDFNNLLAAMLGSLEMVEEMCPETARPDFATIRHSIMRARDLTRQLLAFARKQPVERRVIDLVTLVANAKTMLGRLSGPEIEIVIDTVSRALIRADPSLIEQVLVNLVVNAREAMPKGGRLEVRVTTRHATSENESGVAVLSVADSGIGMDEDVRRHAFDPFFTTKSLGTGLGLASCYGIIRQHQGQIDVASKPGEGAVFRVTLPLVRDSVPTVQDTGTSERPPLAGLLMVVDDESSVREAVARMARSLGYQVVVASNGQEATRMLELQQTRLELLICDIAMPGEDGPSVVQRLRKIQPELRVLFMSGYSPDLREVRLPRSLFIQKPFSLKEMTERLAELGRAS